MIHSSVRVLYAAISILIVSTPCFGQGANPVRFVDANFMANLKIRFVEFSFSADETWYVAGACEGAPDAPRIKVVEFSFSADISVKLTSFPIGADKVICIVNPDDAPKEFWEAYNKI